MRHHVMAVFGLGLLVTVLCDSANGQLTITDPANAASEIRQASLSTPVPAPEQLSFGNKRPINRDLSQLTQIRVSVQYIHVDAKTRASIYAGVSVDTIKSATHVAIKAKSKPLEQASIGSSCHGQIKSPTRVSTCVLRNTDSESILQMARQAVASDVSRAPSVLLLDGKEAELNDLVQRPFVIDLQPDGAVMKPVVHVLDDGKRLRLLAKVVDTDQIQLTAEIEVSQVLDIKTMEVFGEQDTALTVQVPFQQITTSVAKEQLESGQTLLIDPHLTTKKIVQSEAKVPVLGSIPYVGRSFRNVNQASVEQHLLILLQPSIEKIKR
ncbi:MAG: hypothetical protein AB8B91_11510 [Rubripirellula sp.]